MKEAEDGLIQLSQEALKKGVLLTGLVSVITLLSAVIFLAISMLILALAESSGNKVFALIICYAGAIICFTKSQLAKDRCVEILTKMN